MTAVFALQSYQVTARAVDETGQQLGAENITLSPPADGIGYRFGEQITVTAQPMAGWKFLRWQSGLSGSATSATVTIQGDLLIQGLFAAATTTT
ncbi:MAG: hypothetical protein R2932_25180 [Caldilineaceae bacterium]